MNNGIENGRIGMQENRINIIYYRIQLIFATTIYVDDFIGILIAIRIVTTER